MFNLIRTDAGLARPLAEGHPYLRAEVAYAVTHEDALHVEDVLMRRTRLFIESADAGAGAAGEVSTIMGRLLGLAGGGAPPRRAGTSTRSRSSAPRAPLIPSRRHSVPWRDEPAGRHGDASPLVVSLPPDPAVT